MGADHAKARCQPSPAAGGFQLPSRPLPPRRGFRHDGAVSQGERWTMCRAMVYLGQPVLIDDLIYQPDSSLVKQSFMPRMLHMLNLAGFGMMAWDRRSHDPDRPHAYRATSLPVFDRNLESLARKVQADCAIAHVRGVAYNTDVVISLQNTHPFHFPDVALAMAHNGDLYRIDEMKPLLAPHIQPAFLSQIKGTTDSEWVYALLISQLADPSVPSGGEDLRRAVEATLRILRRISTTITPPPAARLPRSASALRPRASPGLPA